MVKVRSRFARSAGPGRRIPVRATRGLAILITIGVLSLAPHAARAQNALEATQIIIGAPAQADLGKPLTVQALLTDSQGHPISKAVIYFTVQATFLHESSDEVLAQAVTNGSGQAVATFADERSGTATINAEFRGDAQYAASTASTPVAAGADQQVYSDQVGVDIPGLNVPPISRSMASIQSPLAGLWQFVASLWPAMNGWPLAAALLLVWSNYFLAMTFVFRLAALGSNPESPSADSRRSS